MPQVFHHSTNLISRLTIYGSFVFVFVAGLIPFGSTVRPMSPRRMFPASSPSFQPSASCQRTGNRLPLLPHLGRGILLRRLAAHGNVHDLPFADLDQQPDARAGAGKFSQNQSIQWLRVNALPEFVYFNHSIHIAKGIGCTTCHGPVGDMTLTWAANSMKMGWCLDCHRHPENNVRPKDQVFSISYQPPPNQAELGRSSSRNTKSVRSRIATPAIDESAVTKR